MRADFWTKQRIATLKRLWAQGEPASAIARALGGISRAAVLGKIFRLRLGTQQKASAKTRQKQKAAKQTSGAAPLRDRPVRRRGAEPEPKASTTGARASRRKSLFELTNQCCRWPHGQPGTRNFFFCGASGADVESGVPYCPQHMKRAYVVAPASAVSAPAVATSLTPWRVVSRVA